MQDCQVWKPRFGSAGSEPRAQASSRCSNLPRNPLEPLPGQDTMVGWHRAGFTRDHLVYAVQPESNRTQQQRGKNLPGIYTQSLRHTHTHTPDWKTTMHLPGQWLWMSVKNKTIWKTLSWLYFSSHCVLTIYMNCVCFSSETFKGIISKVHSQNQRDPTFPAPWPEWYNDKWVNKMFLDCLWDLRSS